MKRFASALVVAVLLVCSVSSVALADQKPIIIEQGVTLRPLDQKPIIIEQGLKVRPLDQKPIIIEQ